MKDKPKAYQQGWVEFYKLRFKVTPDVLIPRPETELLVDEVLNFVKYLPPKPLKTLTILDLGTGSGNIAISLASQATLGCVKIIATDISEKALDVAKQNAKLHGVEDKIKFIHRNLLLASHTSYGNTKFDIIVTNLPYIPSARILYLDASVKDFEPHLALDGGEDGFELYRKLFTQIKKQGLKPKLIVGEIDYTQGELAILEAQKYFPKAKIEVKFDLAYKQRVLLINCYENVDLYH